MADRRTDRDVLQDAGERLGRIAQELKDRHDVFYRPRGYTSGNRELKRLYERYVTYLNLSRDVLRAAKEHP